MIFHHLSVKSVFTGGVKNLYVGAWVLNNTLITYNYYYRIKFIIFVQLNWLVDVKNYIPFSVLLKCHRSYLHGSDGVIFLSVLVFVFLIDVTRVKVYIKRDIKRKTTVFLVL